MLAPRDTGQACNACVYFHSRDAYGGFCRNTPPPWYPVANADWCGHYSLTFPAVMPPLHAPTHEAGGTDELNVQGLHGLLADPQEPLQRAATGMIAPSNPPGTTNLANTMMGLGSLFRITPIFAGRVHIIVSGVVSNSGANNGMNLTGYWGTGTAPANGAPATGNAWSGTQHLTTKAAGELKGFAIIGGLVGATVGVPIWFDAALCCVAGGTANLYDCQFVAFEL